MSPREKLDRVIASLHDAALDDARLGAAAASIDGGCEVVGTHLVLHDPRARMFDEVYPWRGDPGVSETYVKHYMANDVRVPRVLQQPVGQVVRTHDVYTEAERKTLPVYNEWLIPHGAEDGLHIRLGGPDGLYVIWVLGNSTRPDSWDLDQLRVIERLLPHIRQFVRVRQALAGANALRTSLTALLDNAMVGVIYLDRRGVIVEANARARAILRRGDGLADQAGRLRARVAEDDVRLGTLLARVLPGSRRPATSGSIAVQRAPTLPRLAVHMTPVAIPGQEVGISSVAALALIVDPAAKPRIEAERVAATLGLTRAESKVAVALAEGAPVRDIAATTGRQESSVRWLVKQIHAKLEIPRNADLVRMVLSSAWGTGPPPSEGVARASGTPTRRRSLITPPGRRGAAGH